MALIDHESDLGNPLRVWLAQDLVEDAKDLIWINRSDRQIVVRIAAIIKVEAAQQLNMQQPGYDLLDILRLIVMSRIHQHARLRPRSLRQLRGHAPVGD